MTLPEPALTALIAGLVSIIGGWLMARGNIKTSQIERKLPPYEALAKRMSEQEEWSIKQEERVRKEREKNDCLETRLGKVEDELHDVERELSRDRDWILRAIPAIEKSAPALMWKLQPWPEWYPMTTVVITTTTIAIGPE